MAYSKVFRIPKLRRLKLYTCCQRIILVGIVGFLCIIRADKLLWDSRMSRLARNNLELTVKGIIDPKKCMMGYADTPGCRARDHEDVPEIQTNDNINYTLKKGAKKPNFEDKYENDIANTTIAQDVEKEINFIVNAYVNRSHQFHMKGKKPIDLRNRSLYMAIPPDYSDLIKIVMNTRERCKDASDFNAIIAVHTAPTHFENRAAFRWLYGDLEKTKPYRFKMVFFIGLVANNSLQDLLNKENEKFGDTVQGNFIDAYINMTYKAIMVFDWLDTHCQGMRTLFRVDDDVFMNIKRLFPRWSYVQRARSTKTIMCYRLKNDRVMRTGKWAVPKSLVPGDKYEFMRCPGYFAAVTVDLVPQMNEMARKVPFFWIDDIVMFGLVPNALGGVFFYPSNKWMAGARNSDNFYSCIETHGQECNYWVGITDYHNFQKLYGYISGSIPTVNNSVNTKI